jgi:hypothetical protein
MINPLEQTFKVSNQLVSLASRENLDYLNTSIKTDCFQSISFPSE